MSILSDWKTNMTALGFEPTSIIPLKDISASHRNIARSTHSDKCPNCSDEEKAELDRDLAEINASYDFLKNLYKNPSQLEQIKVDFDMEQTQIAWNVTQARVDFNHRLHITTDKHFSHTQIQVEGNEELLGAVYHDFGFDSF